MPSGRWQVTQKSIGFKLGAAEAAIIAPFEFRGQVLGDIIVQARESNGNAATIKVYGSMGDPNNPEAVPPFNATGDYWSLLTSPTEGKVNASSSKLMATTRTPRYFTVRGLNTVAANNAIVDVLVGWRIP